MYSEAHRPTHLDDVFGHTEIKEQLKSYLSTPHYKGSVFLIGSPGIGKTTLALCAANTFGFELLELNASRSLRSYEDIDRIRDSCRSAVNIASFLRGEPNKITCVVLDEVDGADPHAQNKLIDWVRDPKRRVPIICTGNEVPTIFKRNSDVIQIIRCLPPCTADVQGMFPNIDILPILKECQYDIRRVHHRLQYGISYKIPKYILPPTGGPHEESFLSRQRMFQLPDPLVYRDDKQDNEHWFQTIDEYKMNGNDVGNVVISQQRKLKRPDKQHKTS